MKQFKVIRTTKKKIILYLPKDKEEIYRLPALKSDSFSVNLIQNYLKSIQHDRILLRSSAIAYLQIPGFIIPSTEDKTRFFVKGIPFKYMNVTLTEEELDLAVKLLHLTKCF